MPQICQCCGNDDAVYAVCPDCFVDHEHQEGDDHGYPSD